MTTMIRDARIWEWLRLFYLDDAGVRNRDFLHVVQEQLVGIARDHPRSGRNSGVRTRNRLSSVRLVYVRRLPRLAVSLQDVLLIVREINIDNYAKIDDSVF